MDCLASFTCRPRSDEWWWDEAMFRWHGYEPGTVAPGRALYLSHKHHEDRDRARDVLTASLVHGRPYVLRHRIVTVDGREREVVGAGGGFRRTDDDVGPEVHGHLIAVGSPRPRDRSALLVHSVVPDLPRSADTAAPETPDLASLDRELRDAAGVLQVALGLDADDGMALLRGLADRHEAPLTAIAGRILDVPDRLRVGTTTHLSALLAVFDRPEHHEYGDRGRPQPDRRS